MYLWEIVQTSILLLILILLIQRTQDEKRARQTVKESDDAAAENQKKESDSPPSNEPPSSIEPIILELGLDLLQLVDEHKTHNILDFIKRMRRQYKETFGFVLPKIHLRDNPVDGKNQYHIIIRGVKVGNGVLHMQKSLAIVAQDNLPPLRGEKTQEPSFGIDAYWIDTTTADKAKKIGYTVVEPPIVLSTHLAEELKLHLPILFDHNAMQAYVEEAEKNHPLMVQSCVTDQQKLLQVLRNLLAEGIPICDQQTIIETFGANAHLEENEITELVRQKLRRYIAQTFRCDDGIHAIELSDVLQEEIDLEITNNERLTPETQRKLALAISMRVMQCGDPNILVLCSPHLRKHLKEISELISPPIPFLSTKEIPPTIPIVKKGSITPPPKTEDKQTNDISKNKT